jgi:hypothetical protein
MASKEHSKHMEKPALISFLEWAGWASLCRPRFASAFELKRLKSGRLALKNKLLIAQVGYPLPSLREGSG